MTTQNKPLPKDSASALIEYVLAVSLIGIAMVGVLKGFTHQSEKVARDFELATGSGEFCPEGEICD